MRTFTSLRSQCDRRLGGIPVPHPFDLAAFTQTLNRHRGRELRFALFRNVPATAAITGYWITTERSKSM